MIDPSGSDPLAFWLSWIHPAVMVLALSLAAAAARTGLHLRRSRLGMERRRAGARARHLRLARAAVALVLLGAAGGAASMVWLRGRELLDTFHGYAGLAAAALFTTTAWLGHRLAQGHRASRGAHAGAGLLALLLAAAAAVGGFVLLP